MKVTYCASPVLAIREFNVANRILTENLLRNDKLDVSFNYSALDCYARYDGQAYEAMGDIEKHNPQMAQSFSLWKETLRLYLSAYYYPKIFVDSFNNDDIIVMSCQSNYYDYPFIVELLNRGKRLVLGGANFRIWRTPEFITNMLLEMGVKEKYINNFIIVEGMVDLTTDLYEIIKKWKHHVITENDYSTIWDCERDYFQNIMHSICSVLGLDMKTKNVSSNFVNITFMTNNHCWWGKCKFCGFIKQPKMDFDTGVEAEKIAQNIINTTKRFDSDRVYFSNDYWVFNEKHKRILEILNGKYNINCFTGVNMCRREDYLENINRYNLKYLKVGIEAGTDFALDKLGKGYGTAAVDEMISKMVKILDKDVEVTLHSILDAPQQSQADVVNNYENYIRWRDTLRDNGIKSNVVVSSYAIVKEINDKECIDGNYIRRCNQDDAQSGRIRGLNDLRTIFGDIIPFDSYSHYIPFNRYDKDGNIMPSDLDILSIDMMKDIYGNWGWK